MGCQVGFISETSTKPARCEERGRRALPGSEVWAEDAQLR